MKRSLSLDLKRTAALFVDLQEEHRLDQRYLVEDFEGVLAQAARLQQAARSAAVPVMHAAYALDPAAPLSGPFFPVETDGRPAFSDKDSDHVAICPEAAPQKGETAFWKNDASAFSNMTLRVFLAELRTEWLIVAGVWTEACIAATVRDALTHGLRVLLVKDACGSGTNAMHQTGVLNLANRLYGGAVADATSVCRLLAGDEVMAWQVEGAAPLRFGYDDAAEMYAAL